LWAAGALRVKAKALLGWDIFQSWRYAFAMGLFMLIGGYTYPFYFAATDSLALYSWVCLLALIGGTDTPGALPWQA